MKAEILAVGAELLLGETVNTNAAWISRRLAEAGVDAYFHTTVGDNPARIQQALAQALARSDAVIVTGGLGPTQDDLTVSAIAAYFDAPLIVDPVSEARIAEFFIARGLRHSPSNLKQALRPADAGAISNPVGTAPGLRWEVDAPDGRRALLLLFPGVPRELYAMWPEGRDTLLAFARRRGEAPAILTSRSLHFFGIGESLLGEKIADLMTGDAPSVAPYVGQADVRVRLSARAESEAAALALIMPVREEICRRLAPYYYGEEDETIEAVVGRALLDKRWRLAVAESCTGGLISARLTDVAGSSAYTTLNVVTYSNDEKTRLLGVSPEILLACGAVSAETACAMAQGARQLAGADIGMAITGIAGPGGGSPDKPVGLAWIAWCGLGAAPIAREIRVNPTYARADVKRWFSQYALFFLYQYLRGELTPEASRD
ncbi:MAG: competence/damage-inducible protein A [Vampirovibrionales bacterium]|nr:competence/damage-inducible protein A [Vampirovibrionales bacterium]